MKTLHIYPTSRAIRAAQERWRGQDGLVPTWMRMDRFEAQAVRLGDRALIDPLQRVLLLQAAADFADFAPLNVERTLVKFLSHSSGLFRFFEELAREEVDCKRLTEADAYAEFDAHVSILSHLRTRYRRLLEARGLTDTMFVPESFRLHEAFLDQFERIDLFLEGLLSRYELRLLEAVASRVPLVIHYTSSPFSGKMIERFARMDMAVPLSAAVRINMRQRILEASEPAPAKISARVVAVAERLEQVAEAMAQIDRMVHEGIAADRIALILPDERFKEVFRLYDRLNNLNFAMGFDYAHGRYYMVLSAIADHWRHPDPHTHERLERYGVRDEHLSGFVPSERMRSERFLSHLDRLNIEENDPIRSARVSEAREEFARLFPEELLRMDEWLPLWLHRLTEIRIDDLRGGMVTAMGVLETRGVAFDGVVIVDFNEGIVPAVPTKDQFLNTQVRAFADLPTRSDREALQKHYYHRLLVQARQAVIVYAQSDNRLPSRFLYELGLEDVPTRPAPLHLLYHQASRLVPDADPIVEDFDPAAQTWSASRLGSWLRCRRQYYYRYIRRIPPRPDPTFNEGAFLHTLLEHLYRRQDHFDAPETLRTSLHRLMDALLPEPTPRTAYMKTLWRQKLEPFIANHIIHFRQGWRVVETEKEFRSTIGSLRFKGRIDRIDRAGEQAWVIDYKSGALTEANRSKNLEHTTDFQMNIYRHLLRDDFPNPALGFWEIFGKGALVTARALDEKEALLETHLDTLARTQSFTATKTDTFSRCTYCDYALMCERGVYTP